MASANVGICAIVTAVAVCNIAPTPAYADFVRQFRPFPFWSHDAPVQPRHPIRDKSPAPKEKTAALEKRPLQIIISLADQRISVYDGEELVAKSSVSTGVPGHPTPSGIFSVIGKEIWHRSNLYSNAPMPYMQRITWSGIALHAGDLPGYPASHGCIRLEKSFAIRLWRLTKRGTRVIISRNGVRPTKIASPQLPVSKPRTPPKAAAVIDDVAMTDTTVGSSLSISTDNPQQVPAEIPNSPPTEITPRNSVPISIFVSSKTNTLSVRQGFTPLFETPVTIQDSEKPLGTHVFTLVGSRSEGEDFQWTVVSIPERSPRLSQASVKRQRSTEKKLAETVPPDSSPEKASVALARIAMPPDVVERIADLLVPGSSLILSDQGMSKETGRDTDFIVETR